MNKPKSIQYLAEDTMVDNLRQGMIFEVDSKSKIRKKELESEKGFSIVGVNHFTFRKGDLISIDEVGERTVKFHVIRDNEDKTKKGKVIEFEFNKLIFVKQFLQITDLKDVISQISDEIAAILENVQ